MKIGIDARLWDETGVGRYIRNLLRQLSLLDTHNTYVVFARSKDVEKIKSQISKVKTNEWEIIETNISWHSLPEQILFPRLLAKKNLDIMHFPYFSVPVMYSKPYIVTIHDLIIDHFPTGMASTHILPLYFLKRFFYQQIVRSAVVHAKAIIVPSNATAEELVDHYHASKKKLFVTHEGYEKVEGSTHKKELGKYFLYVGNAYPHKNLEKLLEAFLRYKKEAKNEMKLYLVGKKDFFYNLIEKKIQSLGLKKDVDVLYNTSDEQLTVLYKNAQALFAPSRMEGFGLTPLEAMNNKCLCAVSDIEVFHEVCENAVLYFDPESSESMQKVMLKITGMTIKERDNFLMKGVERSKKFSWSTMAQKTLEIYESASIHL